MRVRSSFATAVVAAVAMVGFSAAFQPAAASPIVIDNFTVELSATATGGSSSPTVSASNFDTGSFGDWFTQRDLLASWGQNNPRAVRTVSAISTGSSGQLQLIQTSTSSGLTTSGSAYSYFDYNSAGDMVNLTTTGTFVISTLATSSTGAFRGYMEISTGEGSQKALVDLLTMWAPNTVTSIPFTAFTAVNPNVDFTQVDYLRVGIRNTSNLAGTTLNGATANFASIAVVPEPSQMVSLAGIGLAYCAFRLRKLRRARGTSKAAAV